MCNPFGQSDAGSQARAQQQQQQQQITSATADINKAFAGYTPQWYQNYTNAYANSAMPGLYNQYTNAQQQFGETLADQGLTKSSTASRGGAELQTELGQQKQQIGNQALNATNQLKQNVASEQTNLVSQANVAADPFSVAQGATAAAAGFASPSLAQPVAGLFQNFANMYLGKKLANTYGGGTGSYPYWGTSGLNLGASLPATIQG